MTNRAIVLTNRADFFEDDKVNVYNDYIAALNGRDVIMSYGGNDTIFAGRGRDVVFVDNSFHDAREDQFVFVSCGKGDDYVQFNLDNYAGSAELRGGSGNDDIAFVNAGDSWHLDGDALVNAENGKEITLTGFQHLWIDNVEYDI